MQRAARAFLQNPTSLEKDNISGCTILLGVWYMASDLALYGSHLLGKPKEQPLISNMWRQLPALAHALPTVAELMHTYLQYPVSKRQAAHHDELYITTLVRQLQLMADHAVATSGHATSSSSSSSSSSARQGHTQQQAAAQDGGSQAGPPACLLLNAALFPPAARAKVRTCSHHCL